MNRHLLIFLDKYVFQMAFYPIVLLAKLRGPRHKVFYPQLKRCPHFLVIRPGGLGDALMAVPFLKALRKNFPDTRVTLMCVEKNKVALQHSGLFDEMLVLNGFVSLFKTLYRIIDSRFDVVLDLEPFRKISSIIAYLSGSAVRVGFDTNQRRFLYTHYVSYANEKNYDSVNMLRQLTVFGIHVEPHDAADISIPLPEPSVRKAEEILSAQGLDPEQHFIVAVAPGVLKQHHRWIMSRFAFLISLMLDEDPRNRIVLMGAPADRPDANEVLKHLPQTDRVANLVGKTAFLDALGIFRLCRILIACDGGVVYMAAAMGCSTISIWGPGVMERFKPPGEEHIGIRKDYFCVPCVNYSRLGEFPPCGYDRACIRNISASDVFREYRRSKKRIQDKLHRISKISTPPQATRT